VQFVDEHRSRRIDECRLGGLGVGDDREGDGEGDRQDGQDGSGSHRRNRTTSLGAWCPVTASIR
jgi:hypothetical protein